MPSPLPTPVRRALDAMNAGDSTAFAACFRPHQGCVEDWGRAHHGDADIIRWSDRELVEKRATVKVIHYYCTEPNGATTVIAELDRCDFHGPATLTFSLLDGRIALMALTA